METSRTALLVGASGLVGRLCLDELLADDAYGRVTVLVRGSLEHRHPKLVEHVIDFHRLQDHAALVQGQDVFCCLGTTIGKAGSREAFRKVDFTYPHELARLASQNGAEQFLIVSSIGANPKSLFFYSRVKGEVEQAVSALPFRSVQIFRPSLLLGERAEPRAGEQAMTRVAETFPFLFTGRFARYEPIEASAVARALLRVAKEHPPGVNVYESDRIRALAEG